MMLPCSEFDEHVHQSKESIHFLVGEYFNATAHTSTPQGVAGMSRANNNNNNQRQSQTTTTTAAPAAAPRSNAARPQHFNLAEGENQGNDKSFAKIWADAEYELEDILDGIAQSHAL